MVLSNLSSRKLPLVFFRVFTLQGESRAVSGVRQAVKGPSLSFSSCSLYVLGFGASKKRIKRNLRGRKKKAGGDFYPGESSSWAESGVFFF